MWTCSQPERMMHPISAIFPSTLVFPHRLPKGIPSVWAACDFCQRPILVSPLFVCFFSFKRFHLRSHSHPGSLSFFLKIRQSRQRGRSVGATDGRQISRAAPASRFASFRRGQTKASLRLRAPPLHRQLDKGTSLLLFFFVFFLKKEKNSLLNVCHRFHSEATCVAAAAAAAGRTQYVGQTNPRPSTPELKWRQKWKRYCAPPVSHRAGRAWRSSAHLHLHLHLLSQTSTCPPHRDVTTERDPNKVH